MDHGVTGVRPSSGAEPFKARKARDLSACAAVRELLRPGTVALRLNPKNEVATGQPMGSTGNLPVSSGNLPLGSEDAGCTKGDAVVEVGAIHVPSGCVPSGW